MSNDFKVQFARLKAQAKDHEQNSRFDQAVQDLRSALALIPSEQIGLRATTTGEITQLLIRINAQKEKEGSISLLLKETASRTGSNFGATHTPITIRISSAQKASVLTKDVGICARVEEGDVEGLLEGLVQLLKEDQEEEDADVKALNAQLKGFIIAILVNLASSPKGPVVSLHVDRECAQLLVNDKDEKIAMAGVALLGSLCTAISTDLSAVSTTTTNEWIAMFLDLTNTGLDPTRSPEYRLASLNALIRSTNTLSISLQIIRHPQLLARILETASDPTSEPLRNICPITISRIIEPIASEKRQPNAPEAKRVFHDQIMGYLESTTSKHKSMGLMALTALFAASSDYAGAILLGDGVIQEIFDMIEFEVDSVQLSTVQMLSSACADQACRKIIGSQDCTKILVKLWKSSKASEKLKSAAAGTLVKVMFVDKELEKSLFGDAKLAEGFIVALKGPKVEADVVANCVESLAYLSIRGFIKEVIVNDAQLVKTLISFLKSSDDKAVQYGLVTVFVNLTNVRKRMSEEEEQLIKLKEVSGESVVKPDPLDDDKRVETRCTKLVAAGIIGPLCSSVSAATASLAAVIAQLFLNLCVDKRHRGKIVQEGGVKALTTLTTKLVDPSQNPSSYLIAAQSLAKIAITTDPSIAFKPISRALDIIRPLIHLLNNDSSTLQQFEGLMALTNLASYDDDVRTRIVNTQGVKAMEYLQFSENNMVRRAATEALCNMMFDPVVFESYAATPSAVDGNSSRLKMMIMLCDVEDYETRRAASGALAILSSHPDACRTIMADSRGVDTIIGLLFGEEEDANPELMHRAVEICKNIANVGGVLAQRLEAAGIVKLLRQLTLSPVEEIKLGAIEALRNLQKAGVNVLAKPQKAKETPGPKIVELD
ncbi:UNVERIFIED_CONTAM: hypothetical protein HDU68_000509 [Siphonaria sp. JEL0065]|nr:hypothetical protein HDU68_000509 [Siphonaria sp. JEL0065]